MKNIYIPMDRVQVQLFDEHADEYDAWYEKHHVVFLSELAAIRSAMPHGAPSRRLEIGTGTGRFAAALGIQNGVDPSTAMRDRAAKKGIQVKDGYAEDLPYKDGSFDVILMNFCIVYFADLQLAFTEAYRVLSDHGILLVGFIDGDSSIGQFYQSNAGKIPFYQHAVFYTAEDVITALKFAGFKKFDFWQTLFEGIDQIRQKEIPQTGYGEGSYVLIKSFK